MIDNGSRDYLIAEFKAAVVLPELLDLAPLIMTVIAMLHSSDGRLPDDRVDLYELNAKKAFKEKF
ncbi:hypothetical protein [Desulfobacter curvatus]|uniref:hypothetical protein n=1 Tax=Desulfobacter curvatus TaxID=2290 RepID=UPI0003A24544|nr:hypothetical protein [Desulfobacter curvatus]